MAVAIRPHRSLKGPFGVSVALHVAVVVAVLELAHTTQRVLPPVYHVQLVAAPPGAPAVGVVNPPRETPAKAPAPPAVTRKAPPTPSVRKAPVPVSKPTKATPTVEKAPPKVEAKAQPKAAGGEEGGKGADVANVKIDSDIFFPFQPYLDNIVRKIRLAFYQGSTPPAGALHAEVTFLIHRDGSVTNIRLTDRSGSFEFDNESQGAVESVGRVKGFGALPDGFADDVLPVVFTFDKRIIH